MRAARPLNGPCMLRSRWSRSHPDPHCTGARRDRWRWSPATRSSSGSGPVAVPRPLRSGPAAAPCSSSTTTTTTSNSRMSSGFTDNYSLWLMPDEATASKVRQEIETQAQRYAGPLFLPHVTLIPDIKGSQQELLDKSAELVARLKKLHINFLDVATGDSYHQCVYILAVKDPQLVEAATLARDAFGKPDLPFKPHMSLLYADIGAEQRAAAAQEAVQRLYGEGAGYDTLLPDNSCAAVAVELWYTPVEDRSLASWSKVAAWPLQD